MKALRNLNVNHIRLFPWKEFKIDSCIPKLEKMLDRISQESMSVTLVLSSAQYDFVRGYPNNIQLSKQDFDKLSSEIGDHKAIHSWDLRNEPHANKTEELSWLTEIIKHVKTVDPNHLAYTGLGATRTLQGDLEKIASLEDVCAIHYYPWRGSDQFYEECWLRNNLPIDFKRFMNAVKTQNKHGLPVWIDETGAGTEYRQDSWNGYTSLKGQDYQYRLLFNQMAEFEDIKAINFWQANKEARFGVFNMDLTEKPCCEAIRQFFSGATPKIPEIECK